MVLRMTLVSLCVLALALPLSGASAVGADTRVAARDVPSAGFQFVPSDVVVDVAGTLTFTNTDLVGHDVVAFDTGPDTNPWCGRYIGDCPLFASPIVGLGGRTVVEGTDQLPASDPLSATTNTYAFFCSVHPWMTGTLTTI